MKLDWPQKYSLFAFDEIDSTNSEALRMANSGAIGDFVILSKIQTGGRGTKGRQWESLEGNLHASILLQTEFDLKKNSQLPFLVANAVFEAINHFAKERDIKLDIKLKWPNDVLVDNKKLAGILLESVSLQDKNYVIIGIGVNIDKAPDINRQVICMKDLGFDFENPNDFLNILMAKFEKLYTQWKSDNNFIKTRKDWMRRAYNLNKVIIVDDGLRRISGVFKEIDFDGSMRLQLAGGQYCNVASGEVLFQDNV